MINHGDINGMVTCPSVWENHLLYLSVRQGFPNLLGGDPQNNLEVGTPLYLFESIPKINDVKIADLKAHNASQSKAL